MKDVETDVRKVDIKDFWEGKTGFTIRADDTEENRKVHTAFKEYCKVETDNSYTQGLRKLLEYYMGDYKIGMIYSEIQNQNIALNDLKGSIIELSNKTKRKEEDDEDDSDAF